MSPARPPVIYPPANVANPTDRLTVRDLFWDEPVHHSARPMAIRDRIRTASPSCSWTAASSRAGGTASHIARPVQSSPVWGSPRFVTRRPHSATVPTCRFGAARRTSFGNSQTGRFLRQFLYDGFNVDERDRRVFDAIWVHIAGAARGSFNERFATPSQGDMFGPTRFPFADADQIDIDGSRGGLLSRYRPDQRPKIFYINTPVEYWGGGRAAALTHTSIDGTRDLAVADNIRIYLLSGTQHITGSFPPPTTGTGLRAAWAVGGQELKNPTPQINVMRALLRALHQWVSAGTPPPASRYPRIGDGTLVPIQDVKFPALPSCGSAPHRRTGATDRREGDTASTSRAAGRCRRQ